MKTKRLLVLLTLLLICTLCACNKQQPEDDAQNVALTVEEEHINSTASSFDEQDGVKLKIRTSSDYYIDGEQIAMTAVLTNKTDGYIPVCSPLGSRGREGALVLSVTADGYDLVCLKQEWGKTMPVSMSDANAPYYFLLEPSESITCTYVFDSAALVNGEKLPLWQTMINADLTVQTGEQLNKRQGGLDNLDYTSREVSVEITFDGTADKP